MLIKIRGTLINTDEISSVTEKNTSGEWPYEKRRAPYLVASMKNGVNIELNCSHEEFYASINDEMRAETVFIANDIIRRAYYVAAMYAKNSDYPDEANSLIDTINNYFRGMGIGDVLP